MRLENVVALTSAQLLTTPEVSVFQKILFDPAKVKRGDLFVAIESDDISLALQNGAYGVLFEKQAQISDTEVAWIKVKNLNDALLRLLRFRFIELELEAYACDSVVLELAKQIDTSEEIVVIDGNIQELVKRFWDLPPKTKALFCPKKLSSDLFIDPKQLTDIAKYPIEVVEKTLFETSFIFDDRYYERIALSAFFIPYLQKLLNFYKTLDVSFGLRGFENLPHFEIVFATKNLTPTQTGASETVLIFERDMEFVEDAMEYLQKEMRWAKLLFLLPRSFEASDCPVCRYYDTTREVFNILKTTPFHFALVCGSGSEILNEEKETAEPKQLTFELI